MISSRLGKVIAGLLLTIAALAAGCSNNEARPAQLTGEEQQQQQGRHATGIESQVRDM